MSITRKLILYFSAVIIAFAIIIGAVFTWTYRSYNQDTIQASLVEESNILADLLKSSNSLDLSDGLIQNSLNRLDLSDVQIWTVDQNGSINYLVESTTMGMGMMRNTSRLSNTTQALLTQVLAGVQISTENIRGVMNSEALTVGTPIINNEVIVGALFVSATIQSISEISNQGLSILFIALTIGLIFAILLGYFLSLRFVRPLKEATNGVEALSKGQYDLTFKHHSQDEIGQLSTQLMGLSSELKIARDAQANLEKMRQNFISDITHELRTPVTIIRGLSEGLKDGIYQSDDVSTQIIEQTKDMQRLINDLLELSKLEDPDFKLDMQPFVWQELIQDVARSATQLLNPKHQALIVTQDEKGIAGYGDAQRLKQMFLAIIDNASKFSAEKANITLSVGLKDGEIVVVIQDFGSGMSETQRKELFVRYKKEHENNPSGNGLGLLIVSKIAQKHGLHILVDSKENEGTRFTFKGKIEV